VDTGAAVTLLGYVLDRVPPVLLVSGIILSIATALIYFRAKAREEAGGGSPGREEVTVTIGPAVGVRTDPNAAEWAYRASSAAALVRDRMGSS